MYHSNAPSLQFIPIFRSKYGWIAICTGRQRRGASGHLPPATRSKDTCDDIYSSFVAIVHSLPLMYSHCSSVFVFSWALLPANILSNILLPVAVEEQQQQQQHKTTGQSPRLLRLFVLPSVHMKAAYFSCANLYSLSQRRRKNVTRI